MKRGLVASLVVAVFVCPAARGVDMPKITEVVLVQRTQELYDAVGPGNQAPWKKMRCSSMRRAGRWTRQR